MKRRLHSPANAANPNTIPMISSHHILQRGLIECGVAAGLPTSTAKVPGILDFVADVSAEANSYPGDGGPAVCGSP